MSLSHCPLCVALALVSSVRGLSLALLVWGMIGPRRRPEAGAHVGASPALAAAVTAS